MTSKKTTRQLAFERLEAKSAPSTLLLLLTTDPEPHGLSDEVVSELALVTESSDQLVATKWDIAHSPSSLLKFIAANTTQSPEELTSWVAPSQTDCDQADEMMKVEDETLHALILSERFPID